MNSILQMIKLKHMKENKTNMKNIPEVGKYYHFWDDGKCGPSRHYICKVEKIHTIKDAKNIFVNVPEYNEATNQNDFVKTTLYDRWRYEVKGHNWLYANDTDYIVEISCPVYDEYNLYAVRTKDGGWFTINVQSWWQSGRLDVTGDIYESVLNDWELHNGYVPYEEYPEANEENF